MHEVCPNSLHMTCIRHEPNYTGRHVNGHMYAYNVVIFACNVHVTCI